nr:MIT domain-containing protein 1-like [Ciona intestinalis]|eukprot:XP_002131188.1 MIT domain-containing protein 1-like [Ciona intestinalis]
MADKEYDGSAGIEASAAKILTRAITLEKEARLQAALICYQEGIDLLFDALKGCKDSAKKKHFRDKLEEYMTRAEQVKTRVNHLKAAGKYHDQTKIEENSTGHSYASLFQPYFDEFVREVWVEDAYIRSYHQVNNFLRFCEFVVTRCKNVRAIHLKTTHDDYGNQDQQISNLESIRASLKSREIKLVIMFSSSLHDREIRLDTGWILKIGRGLDYFKKAEKFSLGFFDMDMRPCHSTTVDVFHSNHTRER